ncbi:hypothetical protein Rifp1Sym_ca00050 [endosymbiont of Riftia pachyptila (vent Ph05)]|uniref:Uncharacterized protein n=2 Tax=sulfur-oxidizing symbionts TaxID=32036 RepID=G2FDA8_9GAMM|nr:hypothetical protein Rifp1Sym_ca00050 [endosymbiont of Riftia pachyptila (vent Ph05)]EGW55194.1 hypothetical protein TevJSym_ae00510 [endosymbiont of Tevnia jerichonana (vent Tica)]
MLHVREVQRKTNDLKRLHNALNEMSIKCTGDNYSVVNCPIIDALFPSGQ